MASPIGRLELVERGGALVAIHFDAPPDGSPEHERGGSPVLVEARRQLAAYFAGTLRVFDLPLRPAGTELPAPGVGGARHRAVGHDDDLRRARRPSGRCRRARHARWEQPTAPTRFPIVLPCHRVIGTDGTLTGYAGGLERKALLLRHEGVPTEADQDALF